MKNMKQYIFIAIAFVAICYIFWSTIVTTGIVVWTKVAIEDVDITITEIVLPTEESLDGPYYRHEDMIFKLPFTDIDQRNDGEVSTRFVSGERTLTILTRESTQQNLGLHCEKYIAQDSCKRYIAEAEDTLNFHSDYEAYLKLIRLSKKDLSIFDSRSEKMVESVGLIMKNTVVGKTFTNIKAFDGNVIDGVVYTDQNRFLSEIFTDNGGYTVITEGITENKLLEILSSMRIARPDNLER